MDQASSSKRRERIRILTADLENTTNMLKYTEKLNDQVKLEKLNDQVKLEESKARSDEVFDLSAPSIFNTTPEDVEGKPLYDSDKSSDSETTGFATCALSFKSSSSKTNEHLAYASSSVDFKTVSKTADQKQGHNVANIPSFVPRAAYVPAGSRNPPASVSAGSAFSFNDRLSAVWRNHAARPMTRPTSLYFHNLERPGCSNQLYIGLKGKMGNSDKTSQLFFGKLKGHICSGDPRTMVDLINLHGLTLKYPQCSNKRNWMTLVKIYRRYYNILGGGDGKITGKGTIRTSKLNFENVYYVEELQNFNLFSVSQICDKKNKVLFTRIQILFSQRNSNYLGYQGGS
ncbi:hypothetical protein Tco_0511080 [Tanacetum coccineum]